MFAKVYQRWRFGWNPQFWLHLQNIWDIGSHSTLEISEGEHFEISAIFARWELLCSTRRTVTGDREGGDKHKELDVAQQIGTETNADVKHLQTSAMIHACLATACYSTKELLGFRRKPMSVEPLIVIESFWMAHRQRQPFQRGKRSWRINRCDFLDFKSTLFFKYSFFRSTPSLLFSYLFWDSFASKFASRSAPWQLFASCRSTTISLFVVLWNSHGLDLHHNGFE